MSLGSKRFLVVSKRYWVVRFFKMTEVKRRIFRIFWHIRIQQNRNCWLSQSRVHFRLWKQWLLDEGHVLKVGALRTLFWERSIFDENSKNESSLDHYRALRKTLWRVFAWSTWIKNPSKSKWGPTNFGLKILQIRTLNSVYYLAKLSLRENDEENLSWQNW